MAVSSATSCLLVALCCCWLAADTEAFSASQLAVLCKTKLALLLGNKCDAYIQTDVDCVVSPWGSWATEYDNGCTVKRRRTVHKYPRNNGSPCPSLLETKACAVANGTNSAQRALNTLKTGLGGFGKFGPGTGLKSRKFNVNFNVNPTTRTKVVGKRQAVPCPPDRDIVIIVDSSGSVGATNFEKALDDVGKLIPHLCGFQPDVITRCGSVRVAVVTYGREPRLVFDLNHSKDRHTFQSNVQSDISDLPQYLSSLSGSTATGDALQFAANRVLQVAHGMRTHSKKTVLILTDGKSNHGSNPVTVANNLYNQYDNLAIIALGIGSGINYNELTSITNHYNPLNPLVILLNDYRSFTNIVAEIIALLQSGQDTCVVDVLDKKRK